MTTYYQINENWYKVLSKLTEAKNPTTLHPTTQATWKYNDPASLATSGIYTEKDLDELRDRIMFPMDQPALLNQMAREMHGHVVTDNEGMISKLLNEDTMEKTLIQKYLPTRRRKAIKFYLFKFLRFYILLNLFLYLNFQLLSYVKLNFFW